MYKKMTTNAKKILIETEQSETVVLRLIGKTAITAFCEPCGADAKMLDLNSAVNYSGQPARLLIREIETDGVHSSQMASGHLLICRNSLQRFRATEA